MKKFLVLALVLMTAVAAACGSSSPSETPETTTTPVDGQSSAPTNTVQATNTPSSSGTSTTPVTSTPTPQPTSTAVPVPTSTTISVSPPTPTATVPVMSAPMELPTGRSVLDELTDEQISCLESEGVSTSRLAELSVEDPPPTDLLVPVFRCQILLDGDSGDSPEFTTENIDCLLNEIGPEGLEQMFALGDEGSRPSLELLRAMVFCEVEFSDDAEEVNQMTLEQLDCLIESDFADEFETFMQSPGSSPDLAVVGVMIECGLALGP